MTEEGKAVYCVQHKFLKCNNVEKMDGRKQEWYPRKNWSSLMIFNNSHPDIKKLSPENINIKSPKWLHRMNWTTDENIGCVPKSFNYLIYYYYDNPDPKAVHYTVGIPTYEQTRDCQYSEDWFGYLTEEEFKKLKIKF